MSLGFMIYLFGTIDAINYFFLLGISIVFLLASIVIFLRLTNVFIGEDAEYKNEDSDRWDVAHDNFYGEDMEKKRMAAIKRIEGYDAKRAATKNGQSPAVSKLIKKTVGYGAGFVFFLSLFVLSPSSSTLAAMYLVPRIVENKDMQQIPANAAKLLNLGLEKFVGDLEKKAVGAIND